MNRRSISSFFADDRAAGNMVAFAGSATISVAQFHRDVAWNVTRLRGVACRRGLLVCADTYWAAVGILALCQVGATVALPSSTEPQSIATLINPDDYLIADRMIGQAERVMILESGQESRGSLDHLDPDHCFVELFTSGSTAQPKRIEKTLRHLECEAAIIEELFAPILSAKARFHATVPYHHLYGLTFGLIWPLLAGRPFRRDAHEVWETVFASDLSDSVLVTSPAHLTRLAGFPALLPSQRPALILSAGAALPIKAAKETVEILQQQPTEIFGSTETGAIAWRSWTEEAPCWSPLPQVQVRQQSDDRIAITSPFIAGPQPFIGEDIIELQPDGRFHARGRADDICKIEGKRISLSTIEGHLLTLPGILEAAVILLEEDRPRLGAVVKLDDARAAELTKLGEFRFGRSLRRQLTARLDTASLPKRWRFVADLPHRAMGKRRTIDLRALFADAVSNDETQPNETQPNDEPAIWATRTAADQGGSARIDLDLYISRDLPQLDGHFPGLPIVPGVALVDWAARFAERYLHLGDGVARVLQVKFRRITSPDSLVTLTLEHQVPRNRLAFTYRLADLILASGSFQVGPM